MSINTDVVRFWPFQPNKVQGLALSDQNTVAIAHQSPESEELQILIDNGDSVQKVEFLFNKLSIQMQFSREALCISNWQKIGCIKDGRVNWLGEMTNLSQGIGYFSVNQLGAIVTASCEKLALWDLETQSPYASQHFSEEEWQYANHVSFYHTNQFVVLKSRTWRKHNQIQLYDSRQPLKPVKTHTIDEGKPWEEARDFYTMALLFSDTSSPMLAARRPKESGITFFHLDTLSEEKPTFERSPEGNCSLYRGYEATLISDNHNHLVQLAHSIFSKSWRESTATNSLEHCCVSPATPLMHHRFGRVELGCAKRRPEAAINQTHFLYSSDDGLRLVSNASFGKYK